MKRHAIFHIAPELLILQAKTLTPQSVQVVGNPLPEDAKFVRSFYDFPTRTVALVVESASFAEVPEGTAIPHLPRTAFKRGEVELPAGSYRATVLGAEGR